jgi:hypothetical protein
MLVLLNGEFLADGLGAQRRLVVVGWLSYLATSLLCDLFAIKS